MCRSWYSTSAAVGRGGGGLVRVGIVREELDADLLEGFVDPPVLCDASRLTSCLICFNCGFALRTAASADPSEFLKLCNIAAASGLISRSVVTICLCPLSAV